MTGRETESYGMQPLTLVDRFGVWLSARAVTKALNRRPSDQPVRALDLGCGYHASLLRLLHPRLKTATAVDFHLSPELARLDRFISREGSVESVLPELPDQSQDLITLINVLEHVSDDAAVLAACWRILAPGGTLLVNVPTWRGKKALEFSAFTLGLSPRVEMDDHKMYYDLRDLWPLLVKAGFKPSALRLRYHKFGLNLFAEACRGIDSK